MCCVFTKVEPMEIEINYTAWLISFQWLCWWEDMFMVGLSRHFYNNSTHYTNQHINVKLAQFFLSSEANLDTVIWNVQYVLANYLSGNSTIINILLHMWTGLHLFYKGWLGVSRARLYRLVTSETIRVLIVITARKGILQRRWRGGCLVNQRGTSPTCTLCKSYNAHASVSTCN